MSVTDSSLSHNRSSPTSALSLSAITKQGCESFPSRSASSGCQCGVINRCVRIKPALLFTAGFHALFSNVSHGSSSGARVSGNCARTNGDVGSYRVGSIRPCSELLACLDVRLGDHHPRRVGFVGDSVYYDPLSRWKILLQAAESSLTATRAVSDGVSTSWERVKDET